SCGLATGRVTNLTSVARRDQLLPSSFRRTTVAFGYTARSYSHFAKFDRSHQSDFTTNSATSDNLLANQLFEGST
ncbi:MAG: hypothetical protein WAM44_18955, partial [Chthoniobacterales bacterium]